MYTCTILNMYSVLNDIHTQCLLSKDNYVLHQLSRVGSVVAYWLECWTREVCIHSPSRGDSFGVQNLACGIYTYSCNAICMATLLQISNWIPLVYPVLIYFIFKLFIWHVYPYILYTRAKEGLTSVNLTGFISLHSRNMWTLIYSWCQEKWKNPCWGEK